MSHKNNTRQNTAYPTAENVTHQEIKPDSKDYVSENRTENRAESRTANKSDRNC